MKFLCVECDHVMDFSDRDIPGDGTMAALFTCGSCGREVAMLTNPMETQLVSSLGVKVGGREVPGQPMELTRTQVAEGRDDAFADTEVTEGTESTEGGAEEDASSSQGQPLRVVWSDDAVERLQQVPSFVRGMVKRIYTDYARENGIEAITPAIMDRARSDLGLEGM